MSHFLISNICCSRPKSKFILQLNVAHFARNITKWDFLSDFQPLCLTFLRSMCVKMIMISDHVFSSFQKLKMTFTLTSPIPGTKIPIFGVLSLLGGFLLQFTMGSFYSFGNMMTYMTSYMRAHGSPNVTYEDFVVVQSTWGMTQGCVMPVSGFLIAMIGEKAAMTSGAFIFR